MDLYQRRVARLELKKAVTTPLPEPTEDEFVVIPTSEHATLPEQKTSLVGTDLIMAIPKGHYGRIAPRSGLALKEIDVTAGVIDSDYRGKVSVLLVNNSDLPFTIKAGDQVAQLILERISAPPVTLTDCIDETERGEDGFGSTGIASIEEQAEDIDNDEFIISYLSGTPTITKYEKQEPLAVRDVPLKERLPELSSGYKRLQNGMIWKIHHDIRRVTTSTELAASNAQGKTEKTLPQMVPSYLHNLLPVFDKATAVRLPDHTEYDHKINLKEGFADMKQQVYPLNPQQRKELNKFLEENLSKGYIRPSKSLLASPFFFVGKKDGSLRPCQDYRLLNENTVKDRYPLPLISDLLDKLKHAKVFTKMDLRAGYNNVRIKKGDEWKAAFIVPGTDGKPPQLYEPTVMFFGLCNSPATFQRMMNTIFADMLQEGWLCIYMDDILIFSQDKAEHEERTQRVIERLQQHDLYLKPEKCAFDVTEVECLGMIIRPGEIAMDPVKLADIADWPVLSNLRQVCAFVGFGNFYRQFIKGFSDKAQPLVALTRKDVAWTWGSDQQKAFDTLKKAFLEELVLHMPDPDQPFAIETDASKFATGAVLRQRDDNGDCHPCGYLSQSFNAAERNYDIYDRELYAVIRALDEWRHYLIGSPYPVTILSDHKNLTYWKQAKDMNRQQARWASKLTEFDFCLVHVPGTQMVQSDTLSRRPDHDDGSNDNTDVVMLPPEAWVAAIDIDTRDTILSFKDDPIMKEGLTVARTGRTSRTGSDWSIDDNLLLYQDRVYVPPDESLRKHLVSHYHNLPSAGHPGVQKTLLGLRRDYWWPSMAQFVARYVNGCGICQQMKVNTHPARPPITPIQPRANAKPFSTFSCDYITDLPPSNGFDSILVVVDHDLTKGVIFIPCNKTIDALGTADAMYREVFKWFGLPDKIISDQGPQFVSKVFQELCKMTGVQSAMSTAFHPQTDGETERVNQELEIYLRCFTPRNLLIIPASIPRRKHPHSNS
ncbi:hypothetical protein IEO21_10329 [Rhodonia placenta]|uniref:Uncharacterized protein n=1 Tax=Rhodonia placenta TaxID=104341 RepID=A0A8H7NSQ2_9APHY|nr:hypothetical protein IEO21_10329 [Postia placenta]